MSESTIEAPQKPRPKPRFIFSDSSSVISTYESFAKEGFAHLMSPQAEFPYLQEKKFLSSVDLSKGPILVTVQNIVRIMAVDSNSRKHEKKEFMYYTTQWEAKNFKNNTIRHIHEHEGKYTQQTKEIVTKTNPQGEEVDVYIRGSPRDVCTTPWDKKKAEEILTGEKTYGEDSINITNTPEVQYTVKFPNSNPSRTGFDKEDFMNLTYQALWDRVSSPQLEGLKRKQNPYG